jgi:hypothetical protein
MTLTSISDNPGSSKESSHSASAIAWWSLGVLVFIGLYVEWKKKTVKWPPKRIYML